MTYVKGYVEEAPLRDASADVIIRNGVFNLAPDKSKTFQEVARGLKAGGRMAIADIVTVARDDQLQYDALGRLYRW